MEVAGLGGIIRSYLPAGDLKRNVLSILSLERKRKEGGLTESRIRQLHVEAPEEIRTALQPFGYYRPVIVPTLEREKDGSWLARYEIDAGPELRYGSVTLEVSGEGAELFRSLVGSFPVVKGAIANHAVYEAAKKAFEDLAGENGYVKAAFTVHRLEVDLEAYTATAVLHFETGRQFLFGEVRFHEDFLDLPVIQGYVTWQEGDRLRLSELLKMQDSLSNAPYFSRVEVEMRVEEAVDGRVPIDVTLTASKPRRYSFGVGYGTDTGFRGNFGVELRRLNRKGHHAAVEGKLSLLENSLSAHYLIPGPYPRTDVLALTAAYADLQPATSKSRMFLVGPSYARARGRWHQTLSLLYQRDTFTVGVDSGTSSLLTPELSFSRVVADDRLETRNGHRLQLDARGAVENVLSSATFFQVRLAGKVIRSLGARWRVLGRAEIGVLATSAFRQLPPRVRYFAGGDLSVRGFSYNTLGSLDEAGNVVGGRFLRVASVETDYKILDRWGGFRIAGFVDVGNATLDFGAIVKTSVGTGLRWRSPIGVVRGDVAFAVSEPGPPLKLHLNIGPDL